MTKSFRESIRQILKADCNFCDHLEESCDNCEKAKAALIEVVQALLPEKSGKNVDEPLTDKWHKAGWDDCIDTILKKMEE